MHNAKLNRIFRIYPAVLIYLFTLFGCEGRTGPAGISPPGTDTTPPTVQLTRPLPLSTHWDEVTVRAEAIDNVAIRECILLFDGSPVMNGVTRIFQIPPYESTFNLNGIQKGWHFISARAYDSAGNVADTPVMPIDVRFSIDLVDSVAFLHHNGTAAARLTIPDSIETDKLWVRFNSPLEAQLLSVRFSAGGSLSDSALVEFKIMEGIGIPDEVSHSDTLSNALFDSAATDFTIDLARDSTEIMVMDDFFVILSLSQGNPEDTLFVMADNGQPEWHRSGIHNSSNWLILSDTYGIKNNIIMDCILYFEPAAADSSGAPDR